MQNIIFRIVAESVADFVFGQVYEESNDFQKDRQKNKDIINNLLQCYIVTAKCSYYNLSSTSNTPPTNGNAPDSPYPQYVGVSRSSILHTYMIGNILSFLTGDSVDSSASQKDCNSKDKTDVWQYYYLKNSNNDSCSLCKESDSNCDSSKVTCGVCKKSLSLNTVAVSPAYLEEVRYNRHNEV